MDFVDQKGKYRISRNIVCKARNPSTYNISQIKANILNNALLWFDVDEYFV